MEEAVGVIIAFSTAWLDLVDQVKIRKGESILIHSGAGGVGQAAFQVCQHFGLEVFVAVGSTAKKQLLMGRYGIPEDHIFSSRDLPFTHGVKRMTNRRGVDVVLNSLAGEFLRESWHLVADFGRFVEIGKRVLLANTGLEMEPFVRNAKFIGLNLASYNDSLSRIKKQQRALRAIFDLMESGKLRVVNPVTLLDYSDMAKAFRTLRSGKVMGKIIIKANPEDIVPVLPRPEYALSLDKNFTSLLSGGLGGIMLTQNGAKNLAFLSKPGVSKGDAKEFLNLLRSNGCAANAFTCDISDAEGLATVIARCNAEVPPLKGLIQCAVVSRVSLTPS